MSDKKHLKFIDSLICVCCANPNPTHHHLLRVHSKYLNAVEGEESFLIPKTGGRGMGKKNPDRFAIPLCPRCHAMLHADGNERHFLSCCNIDYPERFALDLYRLSGKRKEAIQLIRNLRIFKNV